MRRFLSQDEVRARLEAERRRKGQHGPGPVVCDPHLIQNGAWWKVIGTDGHQHGTATRSRDEAEAALAAYMEGR